MEEKVQPTMMKVKPKDRKRKKPDGERLRDKNISLPRKVVVALD
jgi:hypothetical protein